MSNELVVLYSEFRDRVGSHWEHQCREARRLKKEALKEGKSLHVVFDTSDWPKYILAHADKATLTDGTVIKDRISYFATSVQPPTVMECLARDYTMPTYLILSRLWLVASREQVDTAFCGFIGRDTMLCVAPPRSAVCSTIDQAYKFFDEA